MRLSLSKITTGTRRVRSGARLLFILRHVAAKEMPRIKIASLQNRFAVDAHLSRLISPGPTIRASKMVDICRPSASYFPENPDGQRGHHSRSSRRRTRKVWYPKSVASPFASFGQRAIYSGSIDSKFELPAKTHANSCIREFKSIYLSVKIGILSVVRRAVSGVSPWSAVRGLFLRLVTGQLVHRSHTWRY